MEGIAAGIMIIFATWFSIWLMILVPADMARNRGRSALAWVLISLFFSPFLAILLLLIMGDA
ncbi:hypothetical protein HOY34_13755 [Xinfangfangia sp. D13-10-4-6]|uniref:hypothetical protein n=1 Tax=Pseudogemmobacter hezensis TaxID=2737662 RepID=UPI00155312D8|nr:hypothetical protein [Pseudogemmobacter hezensis]NPD16260.1 hypothetical protein [Pseudogemmobacter hezensis]